MWKEAASPVFKWTMSRQSQILYHISMTNIVCCLELWKKALVAEHNTLCSLLVLSEHLLSALILWPGCSFIRSSVQPKCSVRQPCTGCPYIMEPISHAHFFPCLQMSCTNLLHSSPMGVKGMWSSPVPNRCGSITTSRTIQLHKYGG